VILSSLFGCAYNEVYIIAQERAVVSNIAVTTSRPVSLSDVGKLDGAALGDALQAVLVP
jgi:hypothetical protein